MTEPPEYSLPEIERRWLADPGGSVAELSGLGSRPLQITDKYLSESRLRLRRVDDPDDQPLYLFEIEFPDLASASDYAPPDFTRREVTDAAAFTGFRLAVRYGETSA